MRRLSGIHLLIHTCILGCLLTITWPSWLGLQNTPTASLQRGYEYPGYDTRPSYGEAPIMLEHSGMWSTPLLPLLPGPLWPGVVAPDMVLSMSQIELNSVLMLNWIAWNKTVCIKMDLVLNDLQWLMCHKSKPKWLLCHKTTNQLYNTVMMMMIII